MLKLPLTVPVTLLLGLAACGSSQTRRTAPRTTRTAELSATAPATRYGEAPQGERLDHPVQKRLHAVARSAGTQRTIKRAVEPSSALARAARQLAEATGGEPADAETIAFAATTAGLVAPVRQMLAFKAEGRPGAVADRLAPHVAQAVKAGDANRIGVGVVQRGKALAVIVLLQAHNIRLDPVPRQLADGGALHLKGSLKDGYDRPQVFLTTPDGKVRTLSQGKKGETRVAQRARCAGKGEHRVEVMGVGPFGPTVLANMPFWCGTRPPVKRTVTIGGADTIDPVKAGRQLLGLVNQERKKQGLPALRWHDRLARVAREHSQDMRTNGFVGHVSPRTGGPSDRVKRAKVPVGVLLENVGVGPTVAGIHRGLMASPGHRAAILNAQATMAGIGVIRRARGNNADYFATELFASAPKAVDPVGAQARTQKAVLARVAGRRVDKGLAQVAQSVALDLAKGKVKAKAANKVTAGRIRARKIRVTALMAIMGQGPNPEKIGKDKQAGRADLKRVGVGVAKGMRNGAPTLFTVVLLAK